MQCNALKDNNEPRRRDIQGAPKIGTIFVRINLTKSA